MTLHAHMQEAAPNGSEPHTFGAAAWNSPARLNPCRRPFPSATTLLAAAVPGLIGLRVDGPRGALVEVNSETDFVARNAKFQEFVEKVLEVALEKAGGEGPAPRELDVQELLESEHPGSPHIGDSFRLRTGWLVVVVATLL